ncbi:MAG TPA: hypothetical protein GX714_01085 [Chloroflexi bacterium]|jgi:hypothetical protein|nr:hypothetical protein [Chloroflexota bacterium]
MSSGSYPLTASELVLLKGEHFAKRAPRGNVDLLHTGAKVSAAELGQRMVAVAFLACERVGTVRLEVRPKRAFFGLRTVDTLYAEPGDGSYAWPTPSIEGSLRSLAVEWAEDKAQNEIANIVHTLLREDSPDPWHALIERVKSDLAARGLLRTAEQRTLRVFDPIRYHLPETTASLAARQSETSLQEILDECQRTRPPVWKLLLTGLDKAASQRTERLTNTDTD